MASRNERLNAFFAAQRGNSNVYGGPPQPQPAPPKPRLGSDGSGPGAGQMSAAQQFLTGGKPVGQRDSGGGGIGLPSLGSVIGGIGTAITMPMKGVVAATEEFAKVAPDFLEVAQPFSMLVDEDKSREEGRGLTDRLTDPTYGYGSITKKTGSKWADRAIGLTGDIAMDPLTYVGSAATKTARMTGGRAGREALALNLRRSGQFADDVVESAYKYGPAFLDDAAREVGGIGKAGVYFGIGDNSVRIPGTQRLGSALEKGFAKTRANTFSKVSQPVNAKLRVVPELEKANRILVKGEAIDGVTPGEALETVAFYKDRLAGEKAHSELSGRTHRATLNAITDRDAVDVTHAAEAGSDEGLAGAIRGVIREQRQLALADDIDVGYLGDDYMPHRYLQQARKWMNEDPRGQAFARHLGIDPNADPALLQHRKLRGGDTIDFGNGQSFTVPKSGTIKDTNAAFEAQFGFKLLEDDARRLASLYITEIGRARGLRRAWLNLSESGSDILPRLKNVSVEELDELAALTGNKEMKSLLQKQVKLKKAAIAQQAKSASELADQLQKSVVQHFDGTIKALGNDHKDLRGELKAIADMMKSNKATEKDVNAAFTSAQKRVQKQFDDTVGELDKLDETIDALRAEEQLAVELRGAGRQIGSPEQSVTATKLAAAEKAQAELDDQLEMAVDAMDRLQLLKDEMTAANMEMQQWNQIVDSPQLLAEEAAHRAAREETTKVETWIPDPASDADSRRLNKLVEDMKNPDTPAGRAQAEEAERQLRQTQQSQVIVDAKKAEIATLKEDVAKISAERAETEAQLRALGPQWVPLSRRAERKRLLDRLASESEDAASARRALQSAERRQERMRGAARGRTVDAELAEVEADRLLREQAHTNLADDWLEHTKDLNDPKSTTTAAERLQRQQLLEARTAGLQEDDQVLVLTARRSDLDSMKMELEADLRQIADEEFADLDMKGVKPYAERRAEAAAKLAETTEALRRIDADIAAMEGGGDEAILLAGKVKEQLAKENALWTRIANASQTKRWHERLTKLENAIPEANSPQTVAAQAKMVAAIERARGIRYMLDEAQTKMETRLVQREARTLGDLEFERQALQQRLSQLPEPDYNESLGVRLADQDVKYGGEHISDVEAEIVAEEMKALADGVKKANAEYARARRAYEQRWPTENSSREFDPTVARTKDVTDAGVELQSGQTMTREGYFNAMDDASPVVASRRSGKMQRGKAVADDLEPETFEGDLVPINPRDQEALPQGYVEPSRTWDEQAQMWVAKGHDEDWAAREAAKEEVMLLAASAKEARKAYRNQMKAFGLGRRDAAMGADPGDGFAYGKWGNVMLVDTAPANPNAKGWAKMNTRNAISMTEEELAAEVKRQGKWPEGGFKGKHPHAQMARAIGAKVKTFRPGTAGYKQLEEEGIAQSVQRTAAKRAVKEMSPEGKRAVMSMARNRDRIARDRIMNERRLIEAELRQVDAEAAEVLQVALEAQYRADVAQDAVNALSDEIGRAERVVDGVALRQQTARNTRRAADQAVREDGVRAAEAGGQQQMRRQALAVAEADKAAREFHVERLAAVEKRFGEVTSQELNAVSTERALIGDRADRITKVLDDSKARQQRVKDMKKKVPARLKKDKATMDAVDKQLSDLKAVMDDAAAEGTPVSTVTAQLYDSAVQANLAVKANTDVPQLQKMIKDLDEVAKKVKDPNLSEAEKIKAIKGSPFAPIMRTVHDGFTQIEQRAFPEGMDMAMKSEVYDMLTNVGVAFQQEPGDLLKLYDEANQFFKTWATSSPGFHVRNAMSAHFMNLTEGVMPSTSRKGFRLWRDMVNAGKAEQRGSKGAIEKWWNGLDDMERQVMEAVMGSGAGGHFEAAELGSERFAKGGWRLLADNPITRASKHFGADYVEGPARAALAMHYAQRGGGVQEMMGAISRIHFDYSQLSTFDRKMKRIIPFWTFMSRNLPLQFEQMATRPRAYSWYYSLMRNLDVGEEGEGMPEWLAATGGVTVARDVGWLGGRDMVLNPDLPFTRMEEETGNIFPNPTKLASSVSPFLRVPFELGQNRSAFTGRDLFNTAEGEGGAFDQLKYAAENVLPPLSVAQRLTGQGTSQGKALEKQANYVGIPIRSVSDEQRRRALEAAAG